MTTPEEAKVVMDKIDDEIHKMLSEYVLKYVDPESPDYIDDMPLKAMGLAVYMNACQMAVGILDAKRDAENLCEAHYDELLGQTFEEHVKILGDVFDIAVTQCSVAEPETKH